MNTNVVRIVILVAGLCFLFSEVSATSLTVAALDSSAESKAGASIVCDGTSDQMEVQSAIEKIQATGGTVFLSEGTFMFNNGVQLPAGVVLQGRGSGATRIHFKTLGDVYLAGASSAAKGITITGPGLMYITASHTRIEDVIMSTTGRRWTSFGVEVGANVSSIEDIEFRDCAAIDCATSGFMFGSATPNISVVRNVRLINCRAINCGASDRPNPWTVGFDLSETANIDGMLVENCLAAGNWESGFHFEQAPVIKNVVIRNCVSENNGKSPTAEWGAGYVVGEGTHIENSRSINNKYGYFIHDPGFVASGCSDSGSGMSYIIPGSLRAPGSQLLNCSSTGATEYALSIANQDQILVNRFAVEGCATQSPVRVVSCTNTVCDWFYANGSATTSPTPIPTGTPNPTLGTPLPTPTTASAGTATIRFTSSPAGASVYVDGVLVGATPAAIPGIALGKHTFEIRKEGYQTWSQTITVTQAFTTRIMSFNPTLIVMSAIPTLTAIPTGTASIRLTSTPPGASVSVDDREVGQTPVVVSGFTEGKHTIQMKLGGYKTWTQVITVTPDFVKRTMSYNPGLVKA